MYNHFTCIHVYIMIIVNASLSVLILVSIQMYTDLMRLVSALVMLLPARQLTTRWMRGLLLLDVLGGTSALALLGILWRTAWRSGPTVWRMLSEHSMERYTYTYVHAVWRTLATHGLCMLSLVLQPLPLHCYYCAIKHHQLLWKHVLSSETLSLWKHWPHIRYISLKC